MTSDELELFNSPLATRHCHCMENYRLFIAAELPGEVKVALGAAQEQLRRANLPVKWVAGPAMHLTLKFLGATDVALLASVRAAMAGALAGQRPAALRLAELGAFPNLRRPSVIWAGVAGDTAALAAWQASLDAELAQSGIPPETKPFRAHLTLGRVRRDARPEQQAQIGAAIQTQAAPEPAAWAADRIVLFRSELQREGPVYTELAECRL